MLIVHTQKETSNGYGKLLCMPSREAILYGIVIKFIEEDHVVDCLSVCIFSSLIHFTIFSSNLLCLWMKAHRKCNTIFSLKFIELLEYFQQHNQAKQSTIKTF